MKILIQSYCVISQIKAKTVCNPLKYIKGKYLYQYRKYSTFQKNCWFQNFSAGLWPISKLELNVDFNSIIVFYVSNYN